VTRVLAPECAPLFLTDGFREYLIALVTHYGQWVQPERRQAKGGLMKTLQLQAILLYLTRAHFCSL